MKIIQAPDRAVLRNPSLFIAGGISGCQNWQADLIKHLQESKFTVVNPRRDAGMLTTGPEAAEQISWEAWHLSHVHAISFWFPAESICPITLFELGVAIQGNKPIFVGCDREYARVFDLQVQLGIYRPEIVLVHSLVDLAHQILVAEPLIRESLYWKTVL